MTRKDFTLIANALGTELRYTEPEGLFSGGVYAATRAIADALAHTNPRFDRERFLHHVDDVASGRRTVEGNLVA